MRWFRRRSDKEKLSDLLVESEKRLRALGDRPVWSSYDSGPALADMVARARGLLEAERIDQNTLNELWCVFVPTSDWDDVVGDAKLGQSVFEALEKVYGPQVRSSGNTDAAEQ